MRTTLLRGFAALAIAAGATLSFTTPAHASGYFSWEIPETQYDPNGGILSGIAGSGGWVVEVDQPNGTQANINYRVGIVQPDYTVYWGRPTFLDTGLDSTVAVSGTTVVEEHRDFGTGALSYRTGTIRTHRHLPPFIVWGPKFYSDNGFVPALAFVGSTVVEVHQATHPTFICDGNDISSRTGTIQSDGSIAWTVSTNFQFAANIPSIAAVDSNTLIEVETGTPPCGSIDAPLYYLLGTVNSNGTISWGPQTFFDNGWAPRVTAFRGEVVEVHQGTDAPGPLWYRSGVVLNSGVVSWSNPSEYDTDGYWPLIGSSGDVGIEVHSEGGNPPYSYRTGLFSSLL
jgi:hypothetical protein